MDSDSIQIIDNTAPADRPADDAGDFSRTTTTTSTGSRLWSRPSIRAARTKRKYAKWQPERLGVATSSDFVESSDQPSSNDEGGLLRVGTITNTLTNASTIQEGVSSDNINGYQSDSTQPLVGQNNAAEQIQEQDFSTGTGNGGTGTTHQSKDHPNICGLKPGHELDILYENQRGWFFFGVPLYSTQSLLNLDPPPWINGSGKRSFVNITNAQVPDPSWEWAWRTWYVDMSGDVDEQGWQYAFSFSKSSSWHGTHSFRHSFVRRRRWLRLRVKHVSLERHRHSRTGLEMGHTLNEDYFTIHSGVRRRRPSIPERVSRATSSNVGKTILDKEGDEGVEEIRNVPTLMYALKTAIVDREKLDAVRRFVDDGGEELYYLDGKIPDIMTRFIYQASRWQLLIYLKDTTQDLPQQQQQDQGSSEQTKQEIEYLRRKQEYLSRAADTAERHLTSPELLQVPGVNKTHRPSSAPEMLDLTPGNRRNSLLSRVSGRFSFQPMSNGGEIKGIPKAAEIGHESHIY
ncbi:hypothetical protein BJX76DRAFT_343346 [Aspergillus varians]